MVCTIPFGLPVDPDVYNIKSMSSASITSGSQTGVIPAMASCHHTSLPSLRVMSELICLSTITCFTSGHFSNASSIMPLRLMVFSPLYDPSEVITILHSASRIRSTREREEKPANTTECTAPMRAHANTV